jgi:hypothetical protein
LNQLNGSQPTAETMNQREIKFKVWDKNIMSKAFRLDDAAYEGFPRPVTDDNGECRTLANLTWLQFTGLHDKNGTEIYEVDIVKDTDGSIGELVWKGAGFIVLFTKLQQIAPVIPSNVEVIGNIYENPEMLRNKAGLVITHA